MLTPAAVRSSSTSVHGVRFAPHVLLHEFFALRARAPRRMSSMSVRAGENFSTSWSASGSFRAHWFARVCRNPAGIPENLSEEFPQDGSQSGPRTDRNGFELFGQETFQRFKCRTLGSNSISSGATARLPIPRTLRPL